MKSRRSVGDDARGRGAELGYASGYSAAAVLRLASGADHERRDHECREHTALRIIAVSFIALAGLHRGRADPGLCRRQPSAALYRRAAPRGGGRRGYAAAVCGATTDRDWGSRSVVADSQQTLLRTNVSAVLPIGLGLAAFSDGGGRTLLPTSLPQ